MIGFLVKNISSIKVNLAGEVKIKAPNNHFRRKPKDYIMYLVTDGCMKLVEGAEEYTLNKRDILILDPTREHYGIKLNNDVSYIYVHFNCDDIEEVDISGMVENGTAFFENKEDKAIIVPKFFSASSETYDRIKMLIEKLLLEYKGRQLYYELFVGCTLSGLLCILARTMVEKLIFGVDRKTDIVIEVLRYLKDNCEHRISSNDIEENFNMNFDYLNRLFKKRYGLTIMNYFNRYKIEESKRLLLSGMYNVSQTSEKMGFSNEFYFSRVFKKYEGMSPSEYIERG